MRTKKVKSLQDHAGHGWAGSRAEGAPVWPHRDPILGQDQEEPHSLFGFDITSSCGF